MGFTVFQILLIVFGPWLMIQVVRKTEIDQWLSPVVLSYGLGIIVANLSFLPIDEHVSTIFSQATILLAIPMLLYATDLRQWLGQAPKVLLSFGLCILAGIIASTIVAFSFEPTVSDSWILSGMLVGVYTGGTPNMQAIGIALDAGNEVYVLMNAADIFCGGLYLILLTSIMHRLLGYFLPNYQLAKGQEENELVTQTHKIKIKSLASIVLLTLAICAVAIGTTVLLPGGLENGGILLLLLTSLSIAASFIPQVRQLEGAYEAGDYLLLMFCVAVGLQANFSNLLSDGLEVIGYTGAVLLITVLLHLAFSAFFRIDRDTTMIISTAAVYGPVFIGQIASAIRNRQLIFAGMATGLVGIAIGNYLGLAVAWGLKYLLAT
ncbi:MAG: DUF819 family protein [Bacteroidota bacterium]